jgi:type IV pilus assembly protein PilQ
MSSMLGSTNFRFRAGFALSLCAIAAAGILACVGSPSGRSRTDPGAGAIDDVVVESQADASTVTLVGVEQPIFTAFQQTDPDRVVVDLAGVDAGSIAEPVAVYDGTIQEITVSPYSSGSGEMMARVEISLVGAADYDVRPGDGGLVIEISTLAGMGPIGDGEQADQAAPEAESDPWAVTPLENEEDASLVPSVPVATRKATVLTAIDARMEGDGALIHLLADGTVESAATFTLEDPARLVVDLPDVASRIESDRVDVGAPQVERVRIGVHADKVRVVLDGGTAERPFDGRRVIPVATGLVIALGGGEALENAVVAAMVNQGEARTIAPVEDESQEVPIAQAGIDGDSASGFDAMDTQARSAAAAGSVPDSGIVTIYGVEYDTQAERDRVVVLGEQPVDYLVYEPDPETVVLSIQGAAIDPEAAVRIAPEVSGPVSLVTAFDQPDVTIPEVRVVVKRAADLKPEVTRRGSLLIMDFPRTGALAATPPVLSAQEAADLASATATSATDAAALQGGGLPGQGAPPASLPPVGPEASLSALDVPADPASIDPPAAIAILNEGGLMDGKEYVGRRISLDFKEVAIADVLRLIAEVSDLNVIAGDEVQGSVTIRLVDVPWDQALDVILLTKGLGFMRVGNVLRIAPSDVLAQEEELRLQERRAKEKLEDLVVKLQPVNYADVADVSKMIGQLLTPRGSVNTDTRTNTLIIKDIASVIDEATALVKAVDTMTPQVMIEARIVEAKLDFSREFGAVWAFGTNPLTEGSLGGRDFIFRDGASNIAIGNPITANPTGLVNLAATVLDSKFNIDAQLQAAEVNGDGKVISSPRIVTLDNSEASIEQGVSIPFQTFENGDAQLEFVDAVLQLKVTPHITSDKSIIMVIEVSRNEPQRARRQRVHADRLAGHCEEPGQDGDPGEGRTDPRARRDLRGGQVGAPVPGSVPPQDPVPRGGLPEQRDQRRPSGAADLRDAARGADTDRRELGADSSGIGFRGSAR